MDNVTFKIMQESLREATEDPSFKKLRDHELIILNHLNHPSQQIIDEFLQAKRRSIQEQLNRRWLNAVGRDVSDILRGKLEIIDEMLDMKNIFKRYSDLKNKVEKAENKGAA